MDESNFPISIPSSAAANAKSYHFQSHRGIISSTSFTKKKKATTEYIEGRDDFAGVQHIQEERRTLFPETTSLTFDIEHYCMMIEKVRTKRNVRLIS